MAVPAIVPLISILVSALEPDRETWAHLLQHVLPDVVANTLILVLGVASLCAVLGTMLAWLTAVCEFPGRRFFDWALLLPLAVPGYVLAFVAVGFLDYSGPLQSQLRDLFGAALWLPPIRSSGGIIVVMSLTLYPYVYLLARGAFLTQGRRAIEAAQTLGFSRSRAALRVALPMARPWITAGVALVAMETLADFGTVSVFNYDTFTTAIYRAWFGLFSMSGALDLAAVLMLFVLAAVLIERRSRAGARFTVDRDPGREAGRVTLTGARRWVATAFTTVVFLLAFALPFLQLLLWSIRYAAHDLDVRYLGYALHSLTLATIGALLIVAAATVLVYVVRLDGGRFVRGVARIATLGYAIPGTILAVGIFAPVAALNNALTSLLDRASGGVAPALYLQGTLVVLLLAYLARFLAVGHGPLDGAMQRITRSTDEVAMSLGVTGWTLLRRVHLPLLSTGVATGATLVFVDIMKEMPITLITRPFGWDTLAVRIFEMTAEGEWQRAALPAVAIVLTGLIPVALLTRGSRHVA